MQPIAILALAATAAAFHVPVADKVVKRQDEAQLVSILAVLETALPASIEAVGITNEAAAYSIVESEIAASGTPSWLSALPTDVLAYFELIQASIQAGAASATATAASTSNATAAGAGGAAITSTASANSSSSAYGAGAAGAASTSSSNSSAAAGNNTSSGAAGASTSKKSSSAGSGSTAKSTSTAAAGGSTSSASGSTTTSAAGASMPSAIYGMGLAGAIGLVGVLAL
ncbi:hypothetical protein BT93_L4727 [Corymbia citriodora subsp. variegata]|uniref:Uncharacterized protein n=1 Tax=Corymbia citriodora subsp. variegata TaxID=360336 RepID=A0A8T0CJV3_CORYI|nr:hypothetical protein BT93_L4727 [Corymbia citriodora subsp. variegata]